MKRLRYENSDLDRIDAAILKFLIEDARTSVAELARRVELSAPSVSERIRRLEEAGVIRGYTLDIDPAAIGLPLTVWIRIRPLPGALSRVAEILRARPEIVECDRITGDDCYVARAHVSDVAALEVLIDTFADCASTNTSVVQSSPVARRLPPVTGGQG
ncbi:Lrp/AsnC family transcriptional regulator [Hoeflea poritis]|uniref:Lrp/AsnC family transcriptional regulator n=1 Tax=Hoeflea poritis TaxID=2993659 RepID=A0ABT4VQM6_9HYPH|nr:Lrp/AsnC family transcriptional regulator [Hoeflea poritis]MDA4847011.1 Lrp/AsnC family transcriptional regulator [Hoeflea poritis]